MTTAQRILGIDPGSRVTGFGVVDLVDGRPVYLASGAIRTEAGDFPDRLRQIFKAVGEVVESYAPGIVAIENASDVEVFEYSPREVKLAVVGTGAATKEQVQHMILSLLNLAGEPGADAADALAVAVCHAHQRETRARLAAGARQAGIR